MRNNLFLPTPIPLSPAGKHAANLAHTVSQSQMSVRFLGTATRTAAAHSVLSYWSRFRLSRKLVYAAKETHTTMLADTTNRRRLRTGFREVAACREFLKRFKLPAYERRRRRPAFPPGKPTVSILSALQTTRSAPFLGKNFAYLYS